MVRPPLLLALLILIVPIAGIWMLMVRPHNADHVLPTEPASASTFINVGEAYLMCQQFVRNRLQTSSPVAFPRLSEVKTFKEGEHLAVVGYVDSQDGFGVQIRTPYTCNVKPAPGDQWQLVSLHLSQ